MFYGSFYFSAEANWTKLTSHWLRRLFFNVHGQECWMLWLEIGRSGMLDVVTRNVYGPECWMFWFEMWTVWNAGCSDLRCARSRMLDVVTRDVQGPECWMLWLIISIASRSPTRTMVEWNLRMTHNRFAFLLHEAESFLRSRWSLGSLRIPHLLWNRKALYCIQKRHLKLHILNPFMLYFFSNWI
jgi:hypothetical protein